MQTKVALLGRCGLTSPEAGIVKNRIIKKIESTPYGKPSSDLILGQINGIDVVILERFGPHFDKTFHTINNRANIWALKEEGCTHIVAVVASDSLYQNINVGDIVIIDDFLDFTHNRKTSFYDGELNHLQGSCYIQLNPYGTFNEQLRNVLIESAEQLQFRFHKKGTAVIMEGPQYASLGEAEIFRKWGGHIVNHVVIPEVVLAKECAICYACIGYITTEFNSGKPKFHESVTQYNKFLPIMKQYVQVFLPKIIQRDWSTILNGLQDNVIESVTAGSAYLSL